ncbi:MAG: hypothetical protein NVS3B27_04950 [Novosphingobium sp.]
MPIVDGNNRQMSFGRRPLTGFSHPRGAAWRRGPFAVVALGCLASALASCGSSSSSASQPLDLAKSGQQQGTDQHLADNGDHERTLPQGGMAAQLGGDMLTNGARPASASEAMAAPHQSAQEAPAAEDPTQPTAVEPLLDAGGFDPSPQGAGEVDHSTAGGDLAGRPGPKQ